LRVRHARRRDRTEALAQASASIAQKAYAQQQAGGESAGSSSSTAGGARGSSGRDDVVDAEFEEVKDKDRKAS